MNTPQLDKQCAREILALVDAAKVHAPGSELAWIVGWAMRAAGEPVQPLDPRREPEPVPVGRVLLEKRPRGS